MKPLIVEIPFIVPDNTYPLLARFKELIGNLNDIPRGAEYYKDLYGWFKNLNEEQERLDKVVDAVLEKLSPCKIEADFFISFYAYRLEQLRDSLDGNENLNSVERRFVEDKIDSLMKKFVNEYHEIDPDGVNALWAKITNLKLLNDRVKRGIEDGLNMMSNNST